MRELRLPVVVVREAEEAEVVITLRNFYKQKAPGLREAEERGVPIFVLKSNTQLQMEACLTSLYALEVTPNEAAMREVEEAIGLVRSQARPVELSPQNAYLRRLQHQAAERANLVRTPAAGSRSGASASIPSGSARTADRVSLTSGDAAEASRHAQRQGGTDVGWAANVATRIDQGRQGYAPDRPHPARRPGAVERARDAARPGGYARGCRAVAAGGPVAVRPLLPHPERRRPTR